MTYNFLCILAFCNVAIFSMWNDGNKKVSEISKGHLVKISEFKYEGTGLQARKQINWWPNEPVRFRIEGKYDMKAKAWRVKCSIIVNNHETHFMAEFERQGAIDILTRLKFTSFIEDFYRNEGANGCLYERQATFLQPLIKYNERMTTKNLSLHKAHFTIDQNEKCRRCHLWTCASLGPDNFALKTGGSRVGRTKYMCPQNNVQQFRTAVMQRNTYSKLLKFCISKNKL